MPKGTVLENLSSKKWRFIVGLVIASQMAYCLMLYFFSSTLFINEGYTHQSVVCKKNNSGDTLGSSWNDDIYYPSGENACEAADPSEFTYGNSITRVHVFECVKTHYNFWRRCVGASLHVWADKILQFENLVINATELVGPWESTITVKIHLRYSLRFPDYDESRGRKPAQHEIDVPLHCQPQRYPSGEILRLCEPVQIMNLAMGAYWDKSLFLNVYVPDYVTGDLTIFSNRADEMTSVTMFYQKLIFFPIVLILLIILGKRLYLLSRPVTLIEKMLLTLTTSLFLADIPVLRFNYFPTWQELSYIWRTQDFGKNLFYTVLLVFSMIFIREHTIKDRCRKFRHYWPTIVAIFSMGLLWNEFHLQERNIESRADLGENIFQDRHTAGGPYNWWHLFYVSIFPLICILAVQSIFFLCYRLTRTFKSINEQQVALPKNMRAPDDLHHATLNRFKIIMWMTLICVTLTVIEFICGRIRKGRYMWHNFGFEWPITSFLYVHFMWHIYVLTLLYLYKPCSETVVTRLGPNSTKKVQKRWLAWRNVKITHVYNIIDNEPKHPLIH